MIILIRRIIMHRCNKQGLNSLITLTNPKEEDNQQILTLTIVPNQSN